MAGPFRPDGVNSSQRDGRNPGLQSVAPRLLEHCTRRYSESDSPNVSPIASRRHGFGRDGVWVWSLQAQPSCQQDGHEREPKIRVGKAACGHHRAWAGGRYQILSN